MQHRERAAREARGACTSQKWDITSKEDAPSLHPLTLILVHVRVLNGDFDILRHALSGLCLRVIVLVAEAGQSVRANQRQ